MALSVLFDDGSGLVAVDKPAGVLVHSSAWAGPPEHSLCDDVQARFVDHHPLHRLDRQTSGVVWFCRRDLVAQAQAAWASPRARKIYLALVRGHLREPVDIDHAITDDDGGPARPARSRVTPLCCSSVERCSLVEIELFSGRRHQARRHLKHISHPVLGDATHGKGPLNRDYRARYGLERMALHAARARIPHPVSGVDVEVVAPLPADLRAVCARLGIDVQATWPR